LIINYYHISRKSTAKTDSLSFYDIRFLVEKKHNRLQNEEGNRQNAQGGNQKIERIYGFLKVR
jgi:hypothetical protein